MEKQFLKPVVVAALLPLLLFGVATMLADDVDQYSPWSAPVNLGPPVNTIGTDYQPFPSKDGLSLYFTRLEGNVVGGPQDIWVAKRTSETEPWGTPEKLGPGVNSAATENNPFVTIDGHWMYFGSNRTTPDANGVLPFGLNDIYVSHRQNKREDFGTAGWQEPVNLGSGINTAFHERSAIVFEDDLTGVTTLYFDSDRPGLGGQDIYASTLQPDGTFGPAGGTLIPPGWRHRSLIVLFRSRALAMRLVFDVTPLGETVAGVETSYVTMNRNASQPCGRWTSFRPRMNLSFMNGRPSLKR